MLPRIGINGALRWWLLSFVSWLVIAVLVVTQRHVGNVQQNLPSNWEEIFRNWLPRFAVWALISPVVLWLSARFLMGGQMLTRNIARNAVASVATAAFAALLHSSIICLFWPHPSWWKHVQKMLYADFIGGALTYWALAGATHAWIYYFRFRERELLAARLDAQLRQSELQMLRSQLNPHFLFNSLNTITVLMREDLAKAEQLMVKLSALLRSMLSVSAGSELPLQRELELLENYIALEQSRFGDRLRVTMEISPEASGAAVPTMILHPMVENAIRHGLTPRKGAGAIAVRAFRRTDDLVLEVIDDGVGWGDAAATSGHGIGLTNTRSRLEKLYDKRHSLEIESPEGKGSCVRIVMPFKLALSVATRG
jgi:two-component sensor histidine kinase